MKLHSIRMHGFTTFKKSVTLLAEDLGPGVIAVCGDNGCGKSTLLELLGPAVLYRNFPSKSPNNPSDYIDKKRGATAVLIFEAGGLDFKAVLKISPKGKQEANLFAGAKDGWKPLTTGKLKDYDARVEALLGPLRANLASVYGQQGGGGGFESLKPAERKKLFRWYLGLDMVDEYHKEVKNQLAALDSGRLATLEAKVTDLDAHLGDLRAFKRECEEALEEASEASDGAKAVLDKILASAALTDKADRFERVVLKAHDLAVREGNLDEALGKLVDEHEPVDLKAIEEEIAGCVQFLEEVDEASEACDEAVEDYDRAVIYRNDSARRSLLLDDVPCGGEGECAECEFLLEAVAANEHLPKAESDVVVMKKAARAAQKVAKGMLAEGEKTEARRVELSIEYHEGVEADRKAADRKATRARTEEALAGVRRQLADAMEEMDELEDELPFDDDGDVDRSMIATKAEIGHAKLERDKCDRAHRTAAEDLAVAKTNVGHAAAALAKAITKKDEASGDIEKLKPLRMLEEALGPNGFPIYEIDAAGPEVSALINDLLESCYGDRFKVAIRTLSPKKTGGFKEDFDFVVRDTRADEDRTLGQMSGGERTIVGEAVRIGFALYQAERGARYATMLRDEAEGSLSPDNARRYVMMLSRARDIGDFHQIFFVTHSPAAALCADEVVSIAKGKISLKKPV